MSQGINSLADDLSLLQFSAFRESGTSTESDTEAKLELKSKPSDSTETGICVKSASPITGS
jgi:hypothetical protein